MNKSFIQFGIINKPDLLRLLEESEEWFGIFLDAHPEAVLRAKNILERNPSLNGRYFLFQNAVSQDKSPVDFMFQNLQKANGQSSIVKVPDHFSVSISMIPVTLDEVVSICPYPCEHIFVDCEGAELQILQGYSFQHKPRTFRIETHEYLVSGISDQIESLMTENGYELESRRPWGGDEIRGYFLDFIRIEREPSP